ncbi:MAG: glycosyltransferase, partial [Pseudomonadota bacterium]
MRAPISVVIPTLNAAEGLGPTLASLAEGLAEGLIAELILSDGGSEDAIAEVAEAVGARLVSGPAGRGGQLARGAAAARGAWLLFLHADTRLPAGWSAAARAHLESAARRPEGAAGRAAVFRLAFDDESLAARWVAGWANLRTRVFALPYGDQGLLISRALYDAVDGYPDQPLMEDVAIARRLGRGGIALLPL